MLNLEMYGVLFLIAFLFVIFAVFQDIKKREISNWLNFSLVAFALAYRAFYSVYNDWNFFFHGLVGFVFFFGLANLLYYTRVFGGGDAKLLMGFGILLPYNSYLGVFTEGLFFIFILLAIGGIYGLIFSIYLAIKDRKEFSKRYNSKFKRYKKYFYVVLFVFLVLFVLGIFIDLFYLIIGILIYLSFNLFIFIKSVDEMMLVLKKPGDLQEGDWIENDIRVGNKIIRANVHGLNLEEMKLLRKYGKKVYVKEGVPFAPVFLVSLIMVFFFEVSIFSLLAFLP